MSGMLPSLSIEFIADYICPWCYIGKHRMESIQNELRKELKLDILLRPYILYPEIPQGGLPKEVFAKKVKPGMGRALRKEAHLESISINYKKIDRIPNSMEAHRITWLITENELKFEFSKHVFHDYFEDGQDIEEQEYLIETAKRIGVSKMTIGKFLDPSYALKSCENYIKAIKEDFITVVPSIRFKPGLTLPSLQTKETWIKYIRRAARIGV